MGRTVGRAEDRASSWWAEIMRILVDVATVTVTMTPAPLGWWAGEIVFPHGVILQLNTQCNFPLRSQVAAARKEKKRLISMCTIKSLQRAVLVLLKYICVPLVL